MIHEMDVRERYFDWMIRLVCDKRYSKGRSWERLMRNLHMWEFTPLMEMDENRIRDGIGLRDRFEQETGWDVSDMDDDACSVLEMMLALAIRCEEHVMANPDIGNRTGKWFWSMVENLGIADMDDANFDGEYFDHVIMRFLDREYEPDGKGGLFTVHRNNRDMRDVDIWYQAMWHLSDEMRGGYM